MDGRAGWNGPQAQLGIAGLVVAAGWLLPPGATRGASVTALLVLALLEALTRWLPGTGEGSTGGPRLPLARSVPLATAVQALAQGGLLLQLGKGEIPWAGLVGWPLLAAASLTLLAGRTSALAALTAGGAALALGGGWTAESALALGAVAAGTLAAEHLEPRSPEIEVLGWGQMSPAIAVAGGTVGLAVAGAFTGKTALVLLAGLGAATALPRFPRWTVGALALAAIVTSFGLDPTKVSVLAAVLFVPVLLPGVFLRSSTSRWMAALLLALVEVWLSGVTLVAAVLAASILGEGAVPGENSGQAQTPWTAVWVSGSLLAAAYPWLRLQPAEVVLEVLALRGILPGLLWLTAFAFVLWILQRQRPSIFTTGFVLLLVCFGALAARQPVTPPILDGQAQTLTAERFRWTTPAAELSARRLIIDSSLAFSLDLEAGQAVATVRLHHPDGSVTNRILRAGVQTSEWAAQRPDVAAALQAPPPPAWTSFVAPGPFLASRFRGTWELDEAKPVSRISVLRHPKLPPEVTLTLFRVELRP